MIQSIRNLSVTLIRRHRYQPGRLDRPANQHSLQFFQRRRLGRPVIQVDRRPIDCNRCDSQKPTAWPYDAPLPAGLPRLPELPVDRPDNAYLPPVRPDLPSLSGRLADHRGKIIDQTV